jgi:hypothetical protein
MNKSLSTVLHEYTLYLKKLGNTFVKSPTNSKTDFKDPYSSHNDVTSIPYTNHQSKNKTICTEIQLEGDN